MKQGAGSILGSSVVVGALAAASTIDVALKAAFAFLAPLLTGEQTGAALGRIFDRLLDYPESWHYRNVTTYEAFFSLAGAAIGFLLGIALAVKVAA
jgi:NhaP-type Na+/H+ or K+/H+ antiporter